MDMSLTSLGDFLGFDPLENEAEENECRRRGAHQAFIMTASTLLGWESQRIIEDYQAAYQQPIVLENGEEIAIRDEHLDRILYWNKAAENDVTLFTEEDFRTIEQLVQHHNQDSEPLTQARFQKWIEETDFKGRNQFDHLMLVTN